MRQDAVLAELITPTIVAMGYRLWGCERVGSAVRIYIDNLQGVDIGGCAEVSRRVGAVLDVADAMPGHYNLEVSSPGLERCFFHLEQLTAYQGQEVKVALLRPVENGQKRFRGRLKGVAEKSFELHLETGDISLAWEDVDKMQLCKGWEQA